MNCENIHCSFSILFILLYHIKNVNIISYLYFFVNKINKKLFYNKYIFLYCILFFFTKKNL